MKLSLREIAQTTGIAASTISRIENGKLSPTLAIAEKLAAALDLSQQAALEGEPARADDFMASVTAVTGQQTASITTYRSLRRMYIKRGVRRDLSRVSAQAGYEMVILMSGALELRANDGFRENVYPGASIHCKTIVDRTIFAIATQDAELLWISFPLPL
jgi:transcriptional regulator with XRE-family HTH domain